MIARFSVVVGLLGLLCSGCGYSTQRPFRSGIQTVHVEMLESREFRRELEFQLSEALVKRIELDTPYRIAPLRTADTLLTGEILEVRQRALGDDFETGLPRETGATVVMSYRWKDLRTGDTLVSRDRFIHSTEYIPPVGESFSTGMVRGLDGMARSIVQSMETGW
ncbi:MAG: hypothetical protein GY842_12010 [bacterium]|nr:hypothetical protein [bacterium]